MLSNPPRRPRSLVYPTISLIVSAASVLAQSPSVEPVSHELQTLVARDKGYGGGVIRISDAHSVLFEEAAGPADGPQTATMTPDTPFEVASITKAVTSATILRLVEEGRISLDTTLAQALPAAEVRGFDGRITIRQLLSHTSGLPDYWTDGPHDLSGNNAFLRAFLAEPKKFWKPDEILAYARAMPAKPPGSHFNYSDTNYVLLGLIIERLTGQSLQHAFRTMIFDPLGMNDTWLTYRERQRGAAPSHRFEGHDDLNAVPRQSADWASGGLVSTTRDLDRFLRGLATGKLFHNRGTLDLMLQAGPVGEKDISYGLGLYRIKLDGDLGELWGHDGHGNSFAYYWPQRDISFTGTLNQTETDWWPLVEAYIQGDAPGIKIGPTGTPLNLSLSTGWDSLYMFRGENALRANGHGYGSGISWGDLNGTLNITDNDSINVDLWTAVATSGPAYKEFDSTISYTRDIGDLELDLSYEFQLGYTNSNFYANELGLTAQYEVDIGIVTLKPSISYYFSLGPDSGDGNGFVKAGSSYLDFRLDGHVPLYHDIIAVEPWTAFGLNFQYNTHGSTEDDATPFNGANNIEFGLAFPVKINKTISVSGYGAYSHALTNLLDTAPNTFWGGVSVIFSY